MKKFILALAIILIAQIGFAQDYKFGKVSMEEIQQKSHPRDPSVNAAVLYREHQTKFEYNQNDGWYLVTEVFERIKIYNKEGFDYGTQTLALYQGSGGDADKISGLKGYTHYLGDSGKIEEVKLKSDGIFDTQVSKYYKQKAFTMPDMKEGCVIEFIYTFQSPFISNIDEYKFQEMIPVDKVNVTFSTPEYFNYQTHQKGWEKIKIDSEIKQRTLNFNVTQSSVSNSYGRGSGGSTTRTTAEEVKFKELVYKINMKDVPALKDEAYIGNINNYASALTFELSYTNFPSSPTKNYTTDWETVSKTIYDSSSFGGEISQSGFYDTDLNTLLAGATTNDDKILKIYNFVKNKMTWDGLNSFYANNGIKDAYKKNTGNAGDINLLLVSMLRKAGLNANPVLLSTRKHGIPVFPTINGFNYVIAAVESNNKVVLLDATNKLGEPNILEPRILNWQGRLIRSDKSSTWVPLNPTEPAVKNTMLTVNLEDDLSVTGDSQNRWTGHYSLNYRNKFQNKNEEDTRKELENSNGNIEINTLQFENLSQTTSPVTLKYNFEVADAVEQVGDKLYFSPLFFLATAETPFKVDTRTYPIDYGYPVKDRYIVTINLPEGYKIESMPESVAFSLGEKMGNYKYNITDMGTKVQLAVEFAINEALILAEEYASLKQFYELLIDKEKEKVVLTKI